MPFCNKKISSIFGRIIFSPPYTNYPQYTTYGWIRNKKQQKLLLHVLYIESINVFVKSNSGPDFDLFLVQVTLRSSNLLVSLLNGSPVRKLISCFTGLTCTLLRVLTCVLRPTFLGRTRATLMNISRMKWNRLNRGCFYTCTCQLRSFK